VEVRLPVGPDLSNAIITVTVTAPQFDLNGNQINAVSFGIQDINGLVRAWYWNVGQAGPIQWNIPLRSPLMRPDRAERGQPTSDGVHE